MSPEPNREARSANVSVAQVVDQRFRPVLMTAFAFILGVVPLVIATGAGAGSRRAIGTTVWGGMLAATFVGILFIPPLYVLFQRLREHFGRDKKDPAEARHGEPAELGAVDRG